jgi:23S rRNA pseudouridine2605 synthase
MSAAKRGGSEGRRQPQLERVQKLLARAGAAPSRRQAEELIREGRVTINGTVAEIGAQVDPRIDAVKVDGKRVHPHSDHYHYLLLNKPSGVMSTRYDPEGRPTVLDMVPPGLRKALVPVGRLDFQTEGLLLLTDDGDLAHQVAHPRFGCTKRYHVKVKGMPTDRELDKLRGGVVLDGRRTAPCEIQPRRVSSRGREATAGNSWWTVTLTEGRTRQIRDMFLRVGHSVQRLRRVAIGPITGAGLPTGDIRELTEAEVELLRNSSGQDSPRKSPPARRKFAASSPRSRGGTAKAGSPPARLTKEGTAQRGAAKARAGKSSPAKSSPAKGRSAKAGSPKTRLPKDGPARDRPAKGRPAPEGRGKSAKSAASKGPGKAGRPPARGRSAAGESPGRSSGPRKPPSRGGASGGASGGGTGRGGTGRGGTGRSSTSRSSSNRPGSASKGKPRKGR